LHTLRARIEVVFVRECSCPNLSSQRGAFCMGPEHKKPLFGPGLYGPEISSSAWEGSWSSPPSPSLPTGRPWWSWAGPTLVVASGRPTDRAPGSARSSPSGLGVVRDHLNRRRGGIEGRGGPDRRPTGRSQNGHESWDGFYSLRPAGPFGFLASVREVISSVGTGRTIPTQCSLYGYTTKRPAGLVLSVA